ncbi:SDR family oxidoreductase [Oscillatoria sp. FACHB-1406]|uniref:SDR family oxidoreductase n=1 Tax=Oscillatoria sp. FACHB-1406 TaxID=2692846 RepID=UPI00168A03ED|nr:SDR family oxidoreductase [Oscillatoria sp. FACHB-1406]MBD2579461.1 SDR family oxidoreductase [Oscillatoria sp. FACHB-1406]
MTSSQQKRAIVTGASSGIGQATALAFARSGIHVALVGRSRERLEAVAREAAAKGVEAKAYCLDLARVEAVKEGIEAIAADFGEIDILVNNAGMGYTGSLLETPLADWQRTIDLNLTSVFECIRAIVPGMRDRQSGLIINVASIAAKNSFPDWGVYCTSKAAVVALSKVLALEERANGIRTVVIYPGAVNTPIWDTNTVNADFDRAAMLTPETVAESILYAALLPDNTVIEELTLMPSAGSQ